MMGWLKKLLRRVPRWKKKLLKVSTSETVRLIVAIAKLILKRRGGDKDA